MIIDNTAGLQYLLSEDIYLLRQDMDSLDGGAAQPAGAIEETAIVSAKPEPVITEQPIVVAEAPALYFNYLGSNAKQFLILCHYPDNDQMDEKHLEALKSALSRKELALDDVAIVNINKHGTATISQLNEYFKPSRLLLLGAPCLLAGWDKPALNQLTNLGGIKALYTYNFTEMMGDRDKTKAFWEQMKVL
ncbi:MAG: hypothetical protein ABIN91_07015 [Mucilaginibacter sp.]|uniref:hypothetical protein n=1 Tax=Mucilaginibacter sp. TaxID=1882438 RepID=UPI0032642A15